MIKFLLSLYDWFEKHLFVLYAVLVVSIAAFALMASRIVLDEDISSFFDGGDDQERVDMFENLKVQDKVVVMLSGAEPDSLIEAADLFVEEVQPLVERGIINEVISGADHSLISRTTDFVYEHLPVFLQESDYERLESRLDAEGIQEAISNCYNQISSSAGMIVGDVLLRDPLNIGSHFLQKFERFNTDFKYELYGGRLFTEDMGTLMLFLEPVFDFGDTGTNEILVSNLEAAQKRLQEYGVQADAIGGPIVAVYNARQIKSDTWLTLTIALAIIIFVIVASFRNRWSIPLIIIPPVYGALFSLAMVWLVQESISAIAIGAGTIVLGIALSYSIHVISHINHTCDPKQIIKDLAYPLTVGCFTTIVAFLSLIYTNSALLRDMGLFSAFTLIGTTLFCLIFIPHFIKGFRNDRQSRILDAIEHFNGHSFEKNVPVVMLVLVLTIIGLIYYNDVEFDDDMSHINFMPEHVAEAEEKMNEIYQDKSRQVYVVTRKSDMEGTEYVYDLMTSMYEDMKQEGLISDYMTIGDFVIPEEVQKERIERWNHFWDGHRDHTLEELHEAASSSGFREGAFSRFEAMLDKDYQILSYTSGGIDDIPLVSDWIIPVNGTIALVSRMTLEDREKEEVYSRIDQVGCSTVMDRSYFSSKMVSDANDDFNFILFVSSAIVFLALLVSYGRIELTLMTFLPMCVSWIIILGFMAILDIKFNIVNIILATFIFGIGDDFSIFIMDGLLQEYKNGQHLFKAHKTAIFFSAFTTIVGMGVLIFARHPAMKSIAVISVLGLSVVVFVSYTVQPFLFRLFISSQTEKKHFPYTLLSILNTVYAFGYFLIGCLLLQVAILLLSILPLRRRYKKKAVHWMLYAFTRTFMNTMFTVRTRRIFEVKEDFSRPSVIIANHQSFIDILLMLSTTPKLIMVTNDWVWKSPFFGRIIRYADFYHAADGYEKLALTLKDRIDEGYSVMIFPEGTRSEDCHIQRFHKGAFYLAQTLKLDILPVLLYGPGQISSKKQGFYIKKGYAVVKVMKRFRYGDISFQRHYREQAKETKQWYVEQYHVLEEEYGRAFNPYFRDALIKNYTYKGPVLEWYMRVKCRLDGYYDLWDRITPRGGIITDVGCGYGQLSSMLGLLSRERTIYGYDYDEEKIALAANGILSGSRVRFVCADMCRTDFPRSDVFIFNDSLHYVSDEDKLTVLERCLSRLNDKGKIVVREGNDSGDNRKEHASVLRTELWSTKIMRFNKMNTPLQFVGDGWMQGFADRHNLILSIRRCDNHSSETLYLMSKDEF